MFTFTWDELEIHLLPEKAIFIPQENSLMIADPHFGKAAHFRKAGVPIPEILHAEDLEKIKNLIERYQPANFYFLGDLFHSDLNESWFVLEKFLEQFTQTQFILIKGNHDILPPAIYNSSNWEIVPEKLEIGKLILSHEPLEEFPLTKFNLCGHIHPGVRLYGNGRQKMALPAFFHRQNQLILPAFGRFTGLYILSCTKHDKAYVVTERQVIEANFST